MGRKNEWIKEDKIEDLRKEWIMGMYINGRFMVGAYPLLIPNAKGQSQSLGVQSNEMEGSLKAPTIASMGGACLTERPYLRSSVDPTL